MVPGFNVHLVDGTYELFRHFYAPIGKKRATTDVPAGGAAEQSAEDRATTGTTVPESAESGATAGTAGAARSTETDGGDVSMRAVRGVLGSVLWMIENGASHIGVATDHVIESFRNRLWPGYKTGAGVDPLLLAQFEPLEEALEAMGVAVWAMTEFEADDALAAAAARAAADPRVDQVCIWTPDKDLAQCVVDRRVVQVDRMRDRVRDAAGVEEKFGVPPAAIADYLALVGDSADGYPGIPGWGAKSAAAVLKHYGSIDAIPARAADWSVRVRGAPQLAAALEAQRENALLFRTLATLRTDAPVFDDVEALRWPGPRPDFAALAGRIGAPGLAERASKLAKANSR